MLSCKASNMRSKNEVRMVWMQGVVLRKDGICSMMGSNPSIKQPFCAIFSLRVSAKCRVVLSIITRYDTAVFC